ncbi:MAG: response regulator [Anaerolineae bacterium]|nr:response regulator [Anaerolineae bacterium]
MRRRPAERAGCATDIKEAMSPSTKTPAMGLAMTRAPRILIVDDDTVTLALMQDILRRVHCELLVAGSGAEALSALRDAVDAGSEVDLVLLDVMMPDLDGYDVLRQVKADPLLQDTSVILTTALHSVSDKTLGLGLGADDYLTKPFDPQELLARIDAVMRIHRGEQILRRRNQELAMLVEISHAVTSSLQFEEVIDKALDGVREILAVEAAVVVWIEDESGELILRGAVGHGAGQGINQSYTLGKGIIGTVVDGGQPMVVNNVELEPCFSPEVDEPEGVTAHTILCVPLVIREQTVGAFEVVNKVDGAFSDQDLGLLQTIAGSMSAALANANLYREVADFAAELERSQNQLIQAEKMAAVGRLAASIAHEVNNPLQAIHNSLHLCMHEGVREAGRREYLGLAQNEVQRLIDTVHRMLNFYRPSRGRHANVDLNSLIDDVLVLAKSRLQNGSIDVERCFAPELPGVCVVPDQITQVFLNIVINAIDAMPAGGVLHIGTSLTAGGSEAEISFSDTGNGLTPEAMDNLFEPFYTTKPSGTGLGATIRYGIIQRHGGEIEVVNREGRGATFTVRLPLRFRDREGV